MSIGNIVSAIAGAADELFTSDEERGKLAIEEAKLKLEEQRIRANIATQQTQINAQEARHRSAFVAGWRPAVGWICAAALGWQFIVHPLLAWGLTIFAPDVRPPPVFDTGVLMTMLSGMLGIGAMRSFDKVKGVDTGGVGK